MGGEDTYGYGRTETVGVTAGETWRRMAGMTSPDRAGTDSALPPCGASGNVTFHLDVGPEYQWEPAFRRGRKWPATTSLAALRCSLLFHNARRGCGQSQGTVEGGTDNGGPSVFIEFPDGETAELLEASGSHCASCRAEMTALRAAWTQLSEHSVHTAHP